MAEEKKKPHAGHGYIWTDIDHHEDGSATVHHEHEDGKSHKTYAVSDLDGVHDGLEDHLRDPEEIESWLKEHDIDPEKLEELIHPGLHAEALEKAGVDDEKLEEEVEPGIHRKMAEAIKK